MNKYENSKDQLRAVQRFVKQLSEGEVDFDARVNISISDPVQGVALGNTDDSVAFNGVLEQIINASRNDLASEVIRWAQGEVETERDRRRKELEGLLADLNKEQEEHNATR